MDQRLFNLKNFATKKYKWEVIVYSICKVYIAYVKFIYSTCKVNICILYIFTSMEAFKMLGAMAFILPLPISVTTKWMIWRFVLARLTP